MRDQVEIVQTLQKMPGWVKAVVVIVLVALILVFLRFFDMNYVEEFILKKPQLSILISFVIYFLTGFTFIPSSPLTIFMSMLSGPIVSITIAVVANTLSALVQYYLGTTLESVHDFEKVRDKMPAFLQKLPINSPLFLLVGRVIPGGMRGLSIICGFHHVQFSTYLWTTTVMYLLNSIVIVFGGIEVIKLI